MEYQYVKDKDGFMGLEVSYNEPEQDAVEVGKSLDAVHIPDEGQKGRRKGRIPLWKLSTSDPFSHSTVTAGINDAGNEIESFELFELRTGENFNMTVTDKAVRAVQDGTAVTKTSGSDQKAEKVFQIRACAAVSRVTV